MRWDGAREVDTVRKDVVSGRQRGTDGGELAPQAGFLAVTMCVLSLPPL